MPPRCPGFPPDPCGDASFERHPTASHPLVSHLHWDRAAPGADRDARPTADARGDRPEGDIMRKAFFNLYLSWLLVFGGSGTLLRRVA